MESSEHDFMPMVTDEPVIIDFTGKVSEILGIERCEGRPCGLFVIIQAMREVFDSLKEE